MGFELLPLSKEHITQFKRDMQKAFQKGAEDAFGEGYGEVLPESHIDRSLGEKGAAAFEAFMDGKSVGGAIVNIDEETQHNHLDFLYVKNGVHSKGIGFAIWTAIERLFPETEVWITCTPYFEKRNIHFYINKCGFHATRFYNKFFPEPNEPEKDEPLPDNEYFEGMFLFEKKMNSIKKGVRFR